MEKLRAKILGSWIRPREDHDREKPHSSPPSTQEVNPHPHTSSYNGNGTPSDPYIVEFHAHDPSDPMAFPSPRKWAIIIIGSLSVFAITFTSSAYSGSSREIRHEFGTSRDVFCLGVSLFVLGFAVGPALWAPLSELYGRRNLFVITHGVVAIFIAAAAGCRTMPQLLAFRFLSGMFGASSLTNTGGLIADLFPSRQRGLPMAVFSAAPFLGPVLGPIVGGFVTITVGWRWVQVVCCTTICVVWILGTVLIPETYGPVILRHKARQLSRDTGEAYTSVLQVDSGGVDASKVFNRTLRRPWVLLFREPIVLIASIYLSIVYGTIYMFFGAFPIVYQIGRGWNEGVGGLAFLGLMVGMLIGTLYAMLDNRRYAKLGKAVTPEDRLPPGMIGAVAVPVGMFAFAWTNFPSIHWSVSIVLASLFGFGAVLIFQSCLNYLLDAYTIYSASVLAAAAMLRSIIGAAFPMFTHQMYEKLGNQWASSIPAFLTLACLPFPFVMYKYGGKLRMKCKYAHEAAMMMERLQADVPRSRSIEEEESVVC